MDAYALFAQILELIAALVLAPILVGWVNQCRAWLQNRSAPPLLQTYCTLSKLFHKEVVLAHNASSFFRAAPGPELVNPAPRPVPCPLKTTKESPS